MPKKTKKQKKSPKTVAVDILRSAKGSRLKKRVVVEVKKKVKKPPMVKFSTDGVTLTKQEMKFYEKMLGKVTLDTRNRGIEERDSKVIEAEERAILGDTYDKVMKEDPKPMTAAERAAVGANTCHAYDSLPPQDPTRDFGILTKVAESYGIEKKAFEKLMEFLVSAEVISWGDIVNYKLSLNGFIEAKREEKREAERKKEEAKHATGAASIEAAIELAELVEESKQADEKANEINKMVETWENTNTKDKED